MPSIQKRTTYMQINKPQHEGNLQLLYPGRPIDADWGYEGENIPSKDPEQLTKIREEDFALTQASKKMREAYNRHVGTLDYQDASRARQLLVDEQSSPSTSNLNNDFEKANAEGKSKKEASVDASQTKRNYILPLIIFVIFLLVILLIVNSKK